MSRYVCDAPSTATNCAVGKGLDGCSAAKTRGDTRPRRHSVTPKVLRRLRYITFSPLLIWTVLPVLAVSDCLASAFTGTRQHHFADKCITMECKFDATYAGAVRARVCAASPRGRREAACQVFIQNERPPLTVREFLRAGQPG